MRDVIAVGVFLEKLVRVIEVDNESDICIGIVFVKVVQHCKETFVKPVREKSQLFGAKPNVFNACF